MFSRSKKGLFTVAALTASASAGYYFAKNGAPMFKKSEYEVAFSKREQEPQVVFAADEGTVPFQGIPGTKFERTFIAIKPDGFQRALTGEVIKRFERRGYQLVGIKALVPDKKLLEAHYEDLKTKPFFNGLVKHMGSGPVIAMVFQGKDAAKTGRALIGATDPLASQPGSIRGDFTLEIGRNAIHGSDSAQTAQREIALWFKPQEVVPGTPRYSDAAVYDK